MMLALALLPCWAGAQELYPYGEPASNMPAGSLSLKLTNRFQRPVTGTTGSRQQLEAMYGVSRKLMLHLGGSASNYFGPQYRPEAAWIYGKYRFLSQDGLKSHFRLAAFGELAYSRNPWMYEEIDLSGDQKGFQLGTIATYLKNKTAVSVTTAYARQFSQRLEHHWAPGTYYRDGVLWNASVGTLVLPRVYENYEQPNLNLYLHTMGQHNAAGRYFVDLAPAVQLILKSALKLNLGYRFQAAGNMERMATQSVLLSAEYTWLR